MASGDSAKVWFKGDGDIPIDDRPKPPGPGRPRQHAQSVDKRRVPKPAHQWAQLLFADRDNITKPTLFIAPSPQMDNAPA